MLTLIFSQIQRNGYQACVESFNTQLAQQHQELGLDEPGFKLRYQNYVIRVVPPTDVFAALVVSFASATASPLIDGVNIVAPEHDPVALRDYWLHMQMYQFCRKRFPGVRYAMHAGELRLGITSPENLRWHIRSAIEVAGANRIGHGVDLAYEQDPYGLLSLMKQRQVAVEINLSSNDFILGVAGGDHPLLLYHRAGVPIVISTDDAGVLRTNLTEQYVRLARDYPEFSYPDIKKLVYNSIQYSFLEDEDSKKQLFQELDARFGQFEEKVLREVGDSR
ncbi:MAG: hypothetical protein H6555_12610 [Lewinellaceae bacterium]|nr:hypothetical protein [Lewinellaceae bacterium]